jgi:uncharacterized protein involved in exopolysaccharide biosynthesis
MYKEQQNHQTPDRYDDEIDLREMWKALWKGRWIIILCLLVGGGAGVALAVTATPLYHVEVLLSSANSGSSPGSALRSQYGGLAALAGIDLPSSGNSAEALAVLESRSFIAAFITDNKLLPVLFAGVWDPVQNKWKESDPEKQPTLNEGINVFQKKILDVKKDKKSELTTLSIEWRNPNQAAEWANQLVLRANTLLRTRAIADAEKTMTYLEQQIAKTSSVEVRQAIYGLIESQVKTITVARTQDEFAFKVLDPATVPDFKDWIYPKKKMMVGLGLLGGMFVGVLFVFMRSLYRRP